MKRDELSMAAREATRRRSVAASEGNSLVREKGKKNSSVPRAFQSDEVNEEERRDEIKARVSLTT